MVLTMFDPRTNLAAQVVNEVRKHFPEQTFHTVVPRSVRLSEAPSYGQTILAYAPGSVGAIAYAALAQELLEREGRWGPTSHEHTATRPGAGPWRPDPHGDSHPEPRPNPRPAASSTLAIGEIMPNPRQPRRAWRSSRSPNWQPRSASMG